MPLPLPEPDPLLFSPLTSLLLLLPLSLIFSADLKPLPDWATDFLGDFLPRNSWARIPMTSSFLLSSFSTEPSGHPHPYPRTTPENKRVRNLPSISKPAWLPDILPHTFPSQPWLSSQSIPGFSSYDARNLYMIMMNNGVDLNLISALRVEQQGVGRHRPFWLSWQLCLLLCLPLPFSPS